MDIAVKVAMSASSGRSKVGGRSWTWRRAVDPADSRTAASLVFITLEGKAKDLAMLSSTFHARFPIYVTIPDQRQML